LQKEFKNESFKIFPGSLEKQDALVKIREADGLVGPLINRKPNRFLPQKNWVLLSRLACGAYKNKKGFQCL
jgi:hypothetical protein